MNGQRRGKPFAIQLALWSTFEHKIDSLDAIALENEWTRSS